MFLINGTHEGSSGRKNFIHKDENGLLRGEFNAFTDDIAKLSNSQIGGDEVFLFIDRWNIGLFNLFADNL